ncbi:MAG: hypothetical protein E7532_00910 [Ruminococcaceae bacterium]|nr:hypothetical protein [Oscillospiraceae bacterium]
MNSRFTLRLLEALESFFLKKDKNGESRADVYISSFLLVFGLFLIVVGIGIAVILLFNFNVWIIVGSVFCILLGVLAFICWRNQTIRIVSEEKFEYTTFLGNRYEYRFNDITKVKVNADSTTIFVGKKKVHIESIAIVSDRFSNLLNKAIKEKNL